MSQHLKPRPTEYKGVRYRSKSEACVACWLENEIERGKLHGFCYEPKEFAVGRWVPDFMAWEVLSTGDELGLKYVLIEYKPRVPTKTYFEELSSRVESLTGLVLNAPYCMSFCFTLLCGGFYDNAPRWFAADFCNPQITFVERDFDWLPVRLKQKITSTRFDLEPDNGR